MSEVMDVINAFPTPLKLAWAGWAAWGVGQYFWFRHERSAPVRKVTSVAKSVAKKPAVPKTVAAQAADAPVVGRLITPPHVAAEAKPSVPVASQPQPAPVEVPSMPVSVAIDAPVSVFDPSKAVIEQFGATSDDALDKFVRDFEMQDARPRRRRTPVPETPSYGAEAPQTP
jgi:hypothetical protein